VSVFVFKEGKFGKKTGQLWGPFPEGCFYKRISKRTFREKEKDVERCPPGTSSQVNWGKKNRHRRRGVSQKKRKKTTRRSLSRYEKKKD